MNTDTTFSESTMFLNSYTPTKNEIDKSHIKAKQNHMKELLEEQSYIEQLKDQREKNKELKKEYLNEKREKRDYQMINQEQVEQIADLKNKLQNIRNQNDLLQVNYQEK
ncbi:hypothetical protein PPERSA_00752 [Pseudocohnilembus persalinus]|uniref:Uncharacterized protein n=1 Tax=Pseudocohnilembus persalinus TaxID=266149 RepID=A0A0V0R4R8_PSEPJ|nr:hypothetical protein PPERSA_00752 [Pseudocohnilembus persalinus]|eukprot:KRX09473.1 hypothetical protein PPERSA_00752 [Pseudocohnilembus persalinus]